MEIYVNLYEEKRHKCQCVDLRYATEGGHGVDKLAYITINMASSVVAAARCCRQHG